MLILMIEPIGAHGGMQQFDLALCRSLAKRGVDVTLATCDETHLDHPVKFEFWTPFRAIFGNAPAWRRGLDYAYGLWSILQLARREVRRRPVVIHQQFVTLLPAEWFFAVSAGLSGIPCVLTPHDTLPLTTGRLTRKLLPAFYRQYDSLITHSRASFSEMCMISRRDDRVHYIPHGSLNDPVVSLKTPSVADARRRLGLADDMAVVLFLGRIRKDKGLEYLIQGFRSVLRQVPNALLIVAGNPGRDDVTPYEQMIDQLGIRDHVRVRWEYVPDGELPIYYAAANVIALPYIRIDQSAVVMTAYRFSRPVVASMVGGMSEQVKNGITGILVPPRNPGQLADALVRILKDPAMATVMGQAGHTWADELGDWDKIATQTLEIYEQAWCMKKRRATEKGEF